MVFKIFDPFLADPGALLLLSAELKQLIDNLKQFFMLFIKTIYANITIGLPIPDNFPL